ncbi:hypothetical protein [Streptomyces jumonjinensis]|uniref:Uncharacterized protein n=1 Tax=Streptomyces jumonjinensis TaxID=1945 RepID=A0A646KS74_STRJU|nr:hypothetical protein [Streptomyces jumonjinensis]MQT05103.1 hypothetical protein [Streptomyces jumonjinensis]
MSADIYVIKPGWTVQAPYLRTTLRRALEFQSVQSVWSGAEHINNAIAMLYSDELSDSGPWMLTKSQLSTLVAATEWRRAKRGTWDVHTNPEILAHYSEIEKEISEAYRSACHAEGCYRM